MKPATTAAVSFRSAGAAKGGVAKEKNKKTKRSGMILSVFLKSERQMSMIFVSSENEVLARVRL